MKYAITYSPEAQKGLAKLKHSEPASYKKAENCSTRLQIILKLVQAIPSHLRENLRTDGVVRSPRNIV
jgi:hypothetical protein